MFGALDTSTSALVAHRQWMTIISNNMANANTIENAQGEYEPYQRKVAVFAPGQPGQRNAPGVQLKTILEDDATVPRYQPNHKYADENGYVNYPNINSATEQMNAMVASRAYEANITAAEATKTMLSQSLRLLA